MDDISLSIGMITYNHQDYIEQAIEGILQQRTNFSMELIISNDASTDQTSAKIQQIIATNQNPNITIRYVDHPANIGMMKNFKFVLTECSGRYIAICEGDDYWTDPSKLQKQFDFMEEHAECSFCFHKARKYSEKEKGFKESYPEHISEEVLDANRFFKIPTIPTASVLYRNNFDVSFFPHSHGDFQLYCLLLSRGGAGFLNETMSIYRLHHTGVSSLYNSNPYLSNRIKELLIEVKNKAYSAQVRSNVSRIASEHMEHYVNKNRNSPEKTIRRGYLRRLLGSAYFYKLPLRRKLRLIKSFA